MTHAVCFAFALARAKATHVNSETVLLVLYLCADQYSRVSHRIYLRPSVGIVKVCACAKTEPIKLLISNFLSTHVYFKRLFNMIQILQICNLNNPESDHVICSLN